MWSAGGCGEAQLTQSLVNWFGEQVTFMFEKACQTCQCPTRHHNWPSLVFMHLNKQDEHEHQARIHLVLLSKHKTLQAGRYRHLSAFHTNPSSLRSCPAAGLVACYSWQPSQGDLDIWIFSCHDDVTLPSEYINGLILTQPNAVTCFSSWFDSCSVVIIICVLALIEKSFAAIPFSRSQEWSCASVRPFRVLMNMVLTQP